MKRLLPTALLAATSMFAATDAQIIAYFQNQVKNPALTITVESRQGVEGLNGYDMVNAQITDGAQSQVITVFTKDDLIFPDIIDLKSGSSIKQAIEAKALTTNLKKIYTAEDPALIISLGNDPKKETLVKFTDPECPYCRQELAQVEEKLKHYNLKYIFASVHGRSSLEKEVLIYAQTAAAKSDEEKITILRKYYAEDATIDANVSDEEVAKMDALRKKYLGAGIKGVPFYINEKEIM